MSATRREVLALAAPFAIAALATLTATPAQAVSPTLADAIAEYRYLADRSITACERCAEADASPERPPMPFWTPTSIARRDLPQVKLTSSECAEVWFAQQIDNARHSLAMISASPWEQSLASALTRGASSTLQRIEMYRAEAIATLRQMEAAYAPYLALEDAAAEATERAADVLTLIYSKPCHTLADVRAKAAVILHADEHLGLDLCEPHIAAVLKSFLGHQEA